MRAINDNLILADRVASEPDRELRLMPLGEMKTGARARIVRIGESQAGGNAGMSELEQRFLEMGFEENSEITLAHTGPVGRDPMAIRMNGSLVALRRRDAMCLFVEVVKDRV